MLRQKGLSFLVAVIATLFRVGWSVHQEPTQNSTSGCYGSVGPVSLTLNCTTGYVIAIEQIWFGVKQTSTGCPPVYDGSVNDTSCCSPSATSTADDCIFPFNHTNYDNYHSACNGRQTCNPGVERNFRDQSCNSTLFHDYSTFAYIEFVCVDASSITNICSITSANITGSSTYIASEDFPNGMPMSMSPCTCSVQTDDPSATLQVVTIQRQLTRNSNTSRNQSLSLLDSGQITLVEWSSRLSDNTYLDETFDVGGNYVILNLNNHRIVANGTFWVEIRASNPAANLLLDCPAQILTTTTTTAATTTTSTVITTTTDVTTTTDITTTTTLPSTTTSTTPVASTTTTADTTSTIHTTTTMPSSEPSSDDDFLIPFIVAPVMALILLIVLIVVVFLLCRKRRQRSEKGEKLDTEKDDIIPGPTNNDKCEDPVETSSVEESANEQSAHPVQAVPPVSTAMLLVDETPRGSEQATTGIGDQDIEPAPVKTANKSINTENTTVDFEEKHAQVTVDTSEQGSHAFVTTENKDTNTTAAPPMVHKSTKTIKVHTRDKQIETCDIWTDSNKTKEFEDENETVPQSNEPVAAEYQEKPDNYAEEALPYQQIAESQFVAVVTSGKDHAATASTPPVATTSETIRPHKHKKEEKRKRKNKIKPMKNNFIVPVPNACANDTPNDRGAVSSSPLEHAMPIPTDDDCVKKDDDYGTPADSLGKSEIDDSERSSVSIPATVVTDFEVSDINETEVGDGKKLPKNKESQFERLRKKMRRGFYSSQREERRVQKRLIGFAQLKRESRKQKRKVVKEEKHHIDSGIETNSINSVECSTAVTVST